MGLDGKPAYALADAVRRGEISAKDLVDDCFARIDEHNPDLNAFYFLDDEGAKRRAAEIDATIADGKDPGPLAGVPVAVKELEDARNWPSELGSLVYEGRLADEDQTHVGRLRRAGAVLVGKTTSPEYGFVAYTTTKLHGVTRNPWDPTRTPGGSSGGSAAAVSAGLVPIATASDGGGSIRIPASFSGLPGLKPTFGRIPMGPGLPSITRTTAFGCLSPYVRDIARWLDVCAGPDSTDPQTIPEAGFSFEERLGSTDLSGAKAAVSVDLGYATVEPEIAEATRIAAQELAEAAGLSLVDRPITIEDPGLAWAALGAVDTVRDFGFAYPDRLDELTWEVKSSVNHAVKAHVADIGPSLEQRHRVVRELASLFDDVDVLFTPATPNTAFAAEGPMTTEIAGSEVPPWATAAFTIPHNMAGNPAMSLPAGLDAKGLPFGLQIAAPHFNEHVLLELAAIWEKQRPWPRLATGYSE